MGADVTQASSSLDDLSRGREANLAEADEAQAVEFPKLVDYLESVVPASGFLVEDRITLADIAVASPFANLGHAGCPVHASTHPKAAAYVDAILARPSYAGIIAKERAMLSGRQA